MPEAADRAENTLPGALPPSSDLEIAAPELQAAPLAEPDTGRSAHSAESSHTEPATLANAPLPAAAPARPPAKPSSAQPPVTPAQPHGWAASAPVRALLELGDLAAAHAAVQSGADDGLATVVDALMLGQSVLRDAGTHIGTTSSDLPNAAEVMLAPVTRSRQLLIVFGQDGGGFYLPPPPTGAAPHMLYLRDPKHSLGMLGIASLGADYDACLLGILNVARKLGAADLFCLGGGAACYSALRFGLDLGAAGVLAAGTLDQVRRGVNVPGLRPGTLAPRLMRLTSTLGADMSDAYATSTPRPGLVLCRTGSAALARLAALPGASGIEAPASMAGQVMDWAERGGHLRGLMRDLLRCRPVE